MIQEECPSGTCRPNSVAGLWVKKVKGVPILCALLCDLESSYLKRLHLTLQESQSDGPQICSQGYKCGMKETVSKLGFKVGQACV